MADPSFTRINYSVRPNKNIQRKLIAELCNGLRPDFPISEYRYVGMGSMWFSDFVLMHKGLSIVDMISIEKDDPKRANFNKPFKCIRVKAGTTGEILPELNWRKRSIVWLDYDYEITRDVLADVEFLAQHVSSGSLIVVTNDAELKRYRSDGEGEGKAPARLDRLARSYYPSIISRSTWTAEGFPQFAAAILRNCLKSAVLHSGRQMEFCSLFDFYYADGARMVTVGGMVVDASDQEKLQKKLSLLKFPYVDATQQTKIGVPPLTAKEKFYLDTLFPCKKLPNGKKVAFPLDAEQLEAYRKYYLQYPLFTEMAP